MARSLMTSASLSPKKRPLPRPPPRSGEGETLLLVCLSGEGETFSLPSRFGEGLGEGFPDGSLIDDLRVVKSEEATPPPAPSPQRGRGRTFCSSP